MLDIRLTRVRQRSVVAATMAALPLAMLQHNDGGIATRNVATQRWQRCHSQRCNATMAVLPFATLQRNDGPTTTA
jgi:hypothetical protein